MQDKENMEGKKQKSFCMDCDLGKANAEQCLIIFNTNIRSKVI